ncbi:uncharacterized protein M6B38_127100 [Iris pallida]|uniref:Uncharacterized protein n=1 Tax=Iris pallida TaxID=29817 RepID=A0AAX6GGS4_IRIPA|nr:uncharacterized protein M6B38_127100 [Iris pallida]
MHHILVSLYLIFHKYLDTIYLKCQRRNVPTSYDGVSKYPRPSSAVFPYQPSLP